MINGKTYSLNTNLENNEEYYEDIYNLASELLISLGKEAVIDVIMNYSVLKKLKSEKENFIYKFTKDITYTKLHKYTEAVEGHLKALHFSIFKDKTIKTSETEYHFYMVAIEILNIISIERFKKVEKKVLILPHCLNDIYDNCKAQFYEIEYRCCCCRKKMSH